MPQNKIKIIFADIDGTTRIKGQFGKNIPYTTLSARLFQNIPVIPVTGRDLNGWKSIKNYSRVFGTRSSSLYIGNLSDPFRRKYLRPKTPDQIKKFIRNHGCAIVSNGATISSIDTKIILEHFPFTEKEIESLTDIICQFKECIEEIEVSNLPERNTLVLVPSGNSEKIDSIKKLFSNNVDILTIWESKRYAFECTYEDIGKILQERRASRILFTLKNADQYIHIIDKVDELKLEATSNEGSIAITGQRQNKFTAIKWVAEHLQIPLTNCLFLGNDHNDYPALVSEEIGHRILIGNNSVLKQDKRLQKIYGNLPENIEIVEDYNKLSVVLKRYLKSDI